MSPKIKENSEWIWRGLALSLLSLCVYFLVKINDKVDYSYKANVEQQIINMTLDTRIMTLEETAHRLGLNLAEIKERQYMLESKTKRQ